MVKKPRISIREGDARSTKSVKNKVLPFSLTVIRHGKSVANAVEDLLKCLDYLSAIPPENGKEARREKNVRPVMLNTWASLRPSSDPYVQSDMEGLGKGREGWKKKKVKVAVGDISLVDWFRSQCSFDADLAVGGHQQAADAALHLRAVTGTKKKFCVTCSSVLRRTQSTARALVNALEEEEGEGDADATGTSVGGPRLVVPG